MDSWKSLETPIQGEEAEGSNCMSDGFIVIQRKITEWRYWQCDSALAIWMHILVNANWKDGYFKGEPIPRGSFATSIRNLADELELSEKTVRKWLKRFEEDGQIEVRGTNRFTVIKVINYAKYQDHDSQMGKQSTEQRYEQGCEQSTERGLDNRTNKQVNKVTNYTNPPLYTPPSDSPKTAEADQVIDYLNSLTGQRYQHSTNSRKHILARLNEGFTVQDCKTVVDKKSREWLGTDYAKYLRPETLFAPSKFENYLSQIERPRKFNIDTALREEHWKNEQGGNAEDPQDRIFGVYGNKS